MTDTVRPAHTINGRQYPSHIAGSLALFPPDQIVELDLIGLAQPLTDALRQHCRSTWRRLVAENSLLRVLDSDLNLISAPISFFDDQLMSYAKTRQLKSARIIGEVLASFWPERRYQTCDGFLASRVRALVAAGRLEGFGDLWQIQASEVRLLQSSAGCDET